MQFVRRGHHRGNAMRFVIQRFGLCEILSHIKAASIRISRNPARGNHQLHSLFGE